MKPYLIAIDGPSGAGKTTYAQALAEKHRSTGSLVEVIQVEDFYDGWNGPCGQIFEERIKAEVTPLFDEAVNSRFEEGSPFTLTCYNWHSASFNLIKTFTYSHLFIIEGVGAFSPLLRPYIDEAIWIECDPLVGFKRALTRDGVEIEKELSQFLEVQVRYITKTSPSQFADYSIPFLA
jgi:anthranilate synthase component 1/para-aminobenzoate synthetase